jgi:ketosteroid isomerase-like protein
MSHESTTPALVNLQRSLLEALNRHDLDAMMSLFAPNAVWEVVALGTSFEGVTAIRAFSEEWLGSYEEFEVDLEELLDLGNGVTFGVLVQKARPAGSVGYVRYRFAQVVTWVDGVIVRIAGYNDIDQARAAAERLAESRE